ncbi:MAG: type IV pilin protein [Telluria sp.]
MNKQQGFSLIELMIAVVIVGILTAIAVPAYSTYVTRTRLSEAFTALAGLQPTAEQFWANGRTYASMPLPPNTTNFTYTLTSADASSYKVTATANATGKVPGFAFTIDQSGNRATTSAPTGWTTSTTCWVDHKEGTCVQ